VPLNGVDPAFQVQQVFECTNVVWIFNWLVNLIVHMVIIDGVLKYLVAKLTNHVQR